MEQWSSIVVRWANSLKLVHVHELIDFTDGKFFAEFMSRFLPWETKNHTVSQTFENLERGFSEEFPFGPVVKMKEALGGHEEELVKILTLLMYLGSVKHLTKDSELAAGLQDGNFSREVQYRAKCVFQSLLDHHSVLTPGLLTEVLSSRVSEATGQLTAPVVRARAGSVATVARVSPGSPIIFTNESPGGSGSPFRDYLDSPTTRQVAHLQRSVDDRNQESLRLRTDLETEKTEKQFLAEEVILLRQDKLRLETDIVQIKLDTRERMAEMVPRDDLGQQTNSDTQDMFQKNLTELKEQGKYLASVESQLGQVQEDRHILQTRLDSLKSNLSIATEAKHRVEISMEDIRSNMTDTKSENHKLNEHVAELQSQIEDLGQQLQFSFLSGGRKSMAPSMTSFHYNAADMTNVSVDADDSLGAAGALQMGSPGENMADVIGQQKEEKIEQLEVDKGCLENELELEKELRERTLGELSRERETLSEIREKFDDETRAKENTEIRLMKIEEEKSELYVNIEEERALNVAELNKLSSNLLQTEERQLELETELEVVKSDLMELEQKKIRNEEEITSLSSEITNIKESLNEEKTLHANVKEKLEVTENTLSKEKCRNVEISSRLQQQSEEKEKAEYGWSLEREKVEEVKESFEQVRVRCEQLETDLHKEEELKEKTISEMARERTVLGEVRDTLDEQRMAAEEGLANEKKKVQEFEDVIKEDQSKKSQLQEEVRNLKDNLKVSEEQINDFGNKLHSSDEQIQVFENQLLDMKSITNIKQEELETLLVDKERMENMLNGKLDASSVELSNVQGKLEETVNEIEEHDKRFQSLCFELAEEKERSGKMSNDLYEKHTELSSLRSENLKTVEQVTELATSIGNLGEKIQTLEEDLTVSKQEKIHADGRLNKLAELLEEREDNLVKLSNELETVQLNNKDLINKTEQFESKEKDLEEEVKELKRNLNSKEEIRLELENKIIFSETSTQDNVNKIDTLTLQLASLSKTKEAMESEAGVHNENLTANATELKDLRQSQTDLTEKFTEITLQLTLKNEACEHHMNELKDLKLLLTNKEVEIVNKIQSFDKENVKVKKLTDNNENLLFEKEQLNDAFNEEKERLNAEIIELKIKYEDAYESASQLKEELERVNELTAAENKSMDEVLENIEKKRQDSEIENARLKETAAEIGANCDKRGEEIKRLVSEKIFLEESMESIGKEKSETSAESDHKIEFLQSQMDELNSEIDDLKLNNNQLLTEKKLLENEKISLNEERDQVLEQKYQLKIDLDSIQSEKLKLSHSLTSLQVEACSSKENLSSHEVEFASLKSELSKKETQVDDLIKSAETFKARVEIDRKELDDQHLKCKEELTNSQGKLQKIMLEWDSRETLMETLKKENASLAEVKDSLEMEMSTATSRAKNVEEQFASTNKTTEENKLTLLSKIQQLEDKNVASEGQLEKHEDTKSIFESTILRLEEEKQSLMESVAVKQTVEEKFHELEKENATNQAMLKECEEEKLGYESSISKLKEEINKLKDIANEKKQLVNKVQELETDNLVHLDTLKNREVEQLSIESSLSKMEEDKKVLGTKILKLEEDLLAEKSSKGSLASHLSQFITDTNAMKDQLARASNLENQHVKEKEELRNKIKEKDITIAKIEEHGNVLQEREVVIRSLKENLATLEIKYTDLEQLADCKNDDIKEALREQKERYEARHKEVIKNVQDSNTNKMKEFCAIAEEKVTIAEDKKVLAEEKREKMNKIMEEHEKLNKTEIELLNDKYKKKQGDLLIFHDKYEKSKLEIKKLQDEIRHLNNKADVTELESMKRELVLLRTENRTLTTQLQYADSKLREWNRTEQGEPTRRPNRSRESNGINGHGEPTRRSNRSRDSEGSVPGRPTRQSSAGGGFDDTDDSVFKLPSDANTPGRAKTGRTVSDSRMSSAASNRSYRPPTGSGSLFNCDEEAGEVFSSSYLTDLKEGHCDTGREDNSRMSELARRNTLAPAHLKSAYPIESQFCSNASISEADIRHSRLTDIHHRSLHDVNSPQPSPVARLAKAASSLSLDSPSSVSTRSRSSQPDEVRLPPPRPGNAIRKTRLISQRSNSSTSSTTSVTSTRITRHPPSKKICIEGRGALDGGHDDTADISLDLSKRKKRKSGGPQTELDSSQESHCSSFTREGLRGSKRSKVGGNISYNRPGPPTPGRNKSSGNLSLDSQTGRTPDMSRITRSSANLKTPLLDTTNTPKANKSKSKISKMTPLGIRKIMGSAFR